MCLVLQKLLISLIGKGKHLKESADPCIHMIHWAFCVHSDVTLKYMAKQPFLTINVTWKVLGTARLCSAFALCLCPYYLKLFRLPNSYNSPGSWHDPWDGYYVDSGIQAMAFQPASLNEWMLHSAATVSLWTNLSKHSYPMWSLQILLFLLSSGIWGFCVL